MLWRFRQFRRQRMLERHAPDRDLFDRVAGFFPALDPLDPAEREKLFERTTEILATKEFHGAAGLELAPEEHLAVALLGALPVMELGVDWYRDFHTFIIYPAGFIADSEEVDEAGVVHRGRDMRAGEAWAHGPVVLSLADIEQSGQGLGFNVVVHELAHQIDQVNGDMDGFPPLHKGMDPQHWSEVFTEAYERLNHQLDTDIEPPIDPYAAESPAEFFAVTSEYYFDAPEWLKQHEPKVHTQLKTFYTPNT